MSVRDCATFTSCDWGTTNLRVRRVENGAVVATARSPRGVATLNSTVEFSTVLENAMSEIGAVPPVVISGMASSSIGWVELPYGETPFALDGRDAVTQEIEKNVHLVSGVRTASDMMRGEETELLGLSEIPGTVHVVLPGTHSKHCRLQDGCLVDFSTMLTGEMFSVLSKHSILKKSVAEGWNESGFVEGVLHGVHTPLLQALFRVRFRHVIDGTDGVSNGAFLCGTLIGSELANLPSDVPLILATSGELARVYRVAFAVLGLTSRTAILTEEQSELLAVRGQMKILNNLRLHE